MRENVHVDDVDFWHEVMCAHILEASCTDLAPDFRVDLSLWRPSEIQISRIRSVAHQWERTEKHVRHSQCDELVVYLQTRGTAVQVQDGREIALREGDLTCTDSTRPMAMRLQGEFEQILIHIPRSLVLPALGATEQFTSFELGKGNPMKQVILPFLQKLGPVLEQVSPSSMSGLAHTAVSLIMTSLAERSTVRLEHPAWQSSALRYRAEEFIQRNSRDFELSPRLVASAIRVSLRYLQEVFQSVGTTPSAYIWECRLRNSEQDLMNPGFSSLSIGDVAMRSGFSDHAHFSRRFRERFGVSPRDFRACMGSHSERSSQ